MPMHGLNLRPLETSADHPLRLPLSRLLKHGTRDAHRFIERLAFVKGFLRGVIDPISYQRLLIDLHTVYGALEEGLRRHPNHPVLGWSAWPLLWREQSLGEDLDHLTLRFCEASTQRLTWRQQSPSVAAQHYAERIRLQAQHSPFLLLAHAYTRYLGDLSGGQILRRIAGFALDLCGPDGLRFYEFSQIPNIGPFKQDFRDWLDRRPLSVAEQSAVVDEAIAAFSWNGAIFESLQPSAANRC